MIIALVILLLSAGGLAQEEVQVEIVPLEDADPSPVSEEATTNEDGGDTVAPVVGMTNCLPGGTLGATVMCPYDCSSNGKKVMVSTHGTLCTKERVICPTGKFLDFDCKCVGRNRCRKRGQDVKCQSNSLVTSAATHYTEDISSGVCSIGSSVFRECPFKAVSSVPNQFFVSTLHGAVIPLAHSMGKSVTSYDHHESYTCTGCTKATCPTKIDEGRCTGDTTFSSFFQSNLASASDPCVCKAKEDAVIPMWMVGGSYSAYQCWGVLPLTLSVKTPEVAPTMEHEPEITCTDDGLHVDALGETVIKYKSCVNPTCVSGRADESVFDIEWTQEMLYSGEVSTTSLWFPGASQPITQNKKCNKRDVCELIDCHFCMDKLHNSHCVPLWQWAIVSLFILIILKIVLTSGRLIWISCGIIKAIIYPICLIVKVISKKLRKSAETKYMALLMEDPESAFQTTVEPIKVHADKVKKGNGPRFGILRRGDALLVLCIICLIPIGDGCSVATSLTAESRECTKTSSGSSCTISQISRISLSPYGQESCLSFKSSNGDILGSLHMKTKDITLRCAKQSMYWIPEPVKYCHSMKHCWTSAWCSGKGCGDINSTFSDPAWPVHPNGVTHCEASCGCLGCGCFLCEDGCLAYRLGFLNPTAKTWEVMRCPQWEYEVELDMTLTKSDDTKSSITLRPGKPGTAHGMRFSLVSASVPQLPDLDSCFALSADSSFMSQCSDRGVPVKGLMGEIQCPNKHSAETIDESCEYSRDLISAYPDQSSITCVQETLSPSLSPKEILLPKHAPNYHIDNDDRGIRAEVQNTPLIEIQIDTQDLTLNFVSGTGDCAARFLNMSGCYSCSSGAKLDFSFVGKTADSSDFSLECPNLFLRRLVPNGKSTHTFLASFETASVSEDCTMKCGKSSQKITITGSLEYSEFSKRVVRSFGHTVPNPPSNSFKIPRPTLSLGLPLIGVAAVGGGALIYSRMRNKVAMLPTKLA